MLRYLYWGGAGGRRFIGIGTHLVAVLEELSTLLRIHLPVCDGVERYRHAEAVRVVSIRAGDNGIRLVVFWRRGGRRRRRGERVDDDRIKTMWPTKFYDGLDDAERAVLEPPYANRPNILEDGTVEITRRGDRKRQHNREVFKTKYF